VFAFSEREGTVAAGLANKIPKAVKRERVTQLCGVEEQSRAEFFAGLSGTVQEVLVEKNLSDEECGYGHTKCYTPVKIKGVYSKGNLVKVKIEKAEKKWCEGVALHV
jgi:threonylcarbamoyladenosine tRNA methylthiotransferase MtaB